MSTAQRPLSGCLVGLSISESEDSDTRGFPSSQVNRVTVQVVSSLFGQGAGVVFGHDWRDDGVMQTVYAIAREMQPTDPGSESRPLQNLLPWPDEPMLSGQEREQLSSTLLIERAGLPDGLREYHERHAGGGQGVAGLPISSRPRAHPHAAAARRTDTRQDVHRRPKRRRPGALPRRDRRGPDDVHHAQAVIPLGPPGRRDAAGDRSHRGRAHARGLLCGFRRCRGVRRPRRLGSSSRRILTAIAVLRASSRGRPLPRQVGLTSPTTTDSRHVKTTLSFTRRRSTTRFVWSWLGSRDCVADASDSRQIRVFLISASVPPDRISRTRRSAGDAPSSIRCRSGREPRVRCWLAAADEASPRDRDRLLQQGRHTSAQHLGLERQPRRFVQQPDPERVGGRARQLGRLIQIREQSGHQRQRHQLVPGG